MVTVTPHGWLASWRAAGYDCSMCIDGYADLVFSFYPLGCRSGNACRFAHEVPDTVQLSTAASVPAGRSVQVPSRPVGGAAADADASAAGVDDAAAMAPSPIAPSRDTTSAAVTGRPNQDQQNAANAAPASNTSASRGIAPRPIPQSQLGDPRTYQLNQIRRRFSPVEERQDEKEGSTLLTFGMEPSDPDFPFEMDALQCTLRIPKDYPTGAGKPTLRVTNPEMERGYQINVERGFDRIVEGSKVVNLLRCFNALDRELEGLLVGEKAETIKISVNRGKPQAASPSQPQKPVVPVSTSSRPEPSSSSAAISASIAPTTASPAPAGSAAPRVIAPEPVYTQQARDEALQIRNAEVRQLESRLGKQPQFHKSADGLAFTLPIEVRKRNELPAELQAVKQVKLIVPETYNINPCRIELVGVSGHAAEAVATAFLDRVKTHPELTLMNHVNYLSQNMHTMAKVQAKKPMPVAAGVEVSEVIQASSSRSPPDAAATQPQAELPAEQFDKPHIIRISRPPEWDTIKGENDSDSDTSSDESTDEHDEHSLDDNDEAEGQSNETMPSKTTRAPERGILISFPNLELHGIELLTLSRLNIIVKCDRCKDTKDITGLQSHIQDGEMASKLRNESCKKCATAWSAGKCIVPW